MSKFIKILPVLAIVAGITAALAFSSPDQSASKNIEDLYWFEVENGVITDTYLPSGPGAGCDEPSGTICAVALDADEGQVDLTDPNDPEPLTTDPFDSDTRSHRQ